MQVPFHMLGDIAKPMYHDLRLALDLFLVCVEPTDSWDPNPGNVDDECKSQEKEEKMGDNMDMMNRKRGRRRVVLRTLGL